MSVVDYIKELSAPRQDGMQSHSQEEAQVLKDLEEVETTLRSIGVRLKPRFFDVSLAARIGTASRK